jgi:dolichyl-phosphate beta-glucosyltransferase
MSISDGCAVHLSVVIPCFNEEERIQPTLAKVGNYLASQPFSSELVVVDDGSTDGTSQVVKDFEAKSQVAVRLISYHPNHGKGYAVRNGMLEARGRFRLYTDADLSTPIEEVERVLPPLEAGEADVVTGSRHLRD